MSLNRIFNLFYLQILQSNYGIIIIIKKQLFCLPNTFSIFHVWNTSYTVTCLLYFLNFEQKDVTLFVFSSSM